VTTTASQPSVSARIADRLAQSVGQQRYNRWFDRSAKLDYHQQQQCLEIAVPNRFVADWIGRHFKEDLQQAAHDEVGNTVDLKVQVDPTRFRKSITTHTPNTGLGDPNNHRQPTRTPPAGPKPILRHSLDDFVVGPNNQLAFAAANNLVDDDDAPANPLFIHGRCGMGKTHLLQGVCKKMLEHQPNARVLYTTGEQFTNEFVASVRTNKINQFRKKIRQLDLLAVDDVHFLADKQATQREFLHSFDAIHLDGARVVLASDSHPKSIEQFSEALVSRCIRGMVVEMQRPDTATCAKLVRALAGRRGLNLIDSVVDVLARESIGSVREIEGTLTKLHALANLKNLSTTSGLSTPTGLTTNRPGHAPTVGHALVDQLLNHDFQPRLKKAVRFDTILDVVATHLQIEKRLLLGKSRQRLAVLARSIAIYLARQLTAMSYPEITLAMGRPNHSTIINAAQRIQRRLDQNEVLILPATHEQIGLSELIRHLKQAIVRA